VQDFVNGQLRSSSLAMTDDVEGKLCRGGMCLLGLANLSLFFLVDPSTRQLLGLCSPVLEFLFMFPADLLLFPFGVLTITRNTQWVPLHWWRRLCVKPNPRRVERVGAG